MTPPTRRRRRVFTLMRNYAEVLGAFIISLPLALIAAVLVVAFVVMVVAVLVWDLITGGTFRG